MARPVVKKVDETVSAPLTERVPPMDEEALLIKPVLKVARPVKVEAPLTVRVLEAERGPETERLAPTDEEAFEINPPENVARPVSVEAPDTPRVPEAETLPLLSTKNFPWLKPDCWAR